MDNRLYEIWVDQADYGPGGWTLVEARRAPAMERRGELGTDPVLVRRFWAPSWEEAVRVLHELHAEEARC